MTVAMKNMTANEEPAIVQVPHELTAFLIAVGCCIFVLFIFFLYLNKALCFRSCPKLMNFFTEGKLQSNSGKLIGAYDDDSHGFDGDTSCDSDDEVLRRYEQAVRLSRPNSQYVIAGSSTVPPSFDGEPQPDLVPDATTVGVGRQRQHRHQHGDGRGEKTRTSGARNGHVGPGYDCDNEDDDRRCRDDENDGRRPILKSSSREMTSYGGLSETNQQERIASSVHSGSMTSVTAAFDNPAYATRVDSYGDCSPQQSLTSVTRGGSGNGLDAVQTSQGARAVGGVSSADSPSPVSATGATRPSTGSSSHQSMTSGDQTSAKPTGLDGRPIADQNNPNEVDQRPLATGNSKSAPAVSGVPTTTVVRSAVFTVGGAGGDASDVGTDHEENLFDVGDLQQEHEPVVISKCGSLRVTFHYQVASVQASSGRMSVTIHEAKDIPTRDRGGSQHTQVHVLLLPSRKTRHRTKIRSAGEDDNPQFDETFVFKVPTDDVGSMGLRLRLYGCERMRRERMIGECIVGFAMLVGATEAPIEHWLTLEPRSNLSRADSKTDIVSLTRSESGSSCQSMGFQHGGLPELLIGLAYNDVTGRLSVQVIKGSNFKNMAMTRAPDTYVKLTLMAPGGQEITRSKTSVRRGQPNPLYKEMFMFQVALFQLPEVTLMVSVFYNRSIKRKEMIGWFSLGYSNSSDDELSHWTEMRENKGEEVCRWHSLLEP